MGRRPRVCVFKRLGYVVVLKRGSLRSWFAGGRCLGCVAGGEPSKPNCRSSQPGSAESIASAINADSYPRTAAKSWVRYVTVTSFPVGSLPKSVAGGDFNGDMKLDFAIANKGRATSACGCAMAWGGFGAAVNFPVGSKPNSVVVGDFNGNLKLVLAIANGTNNSNASVLLDQSP